MKILIDFFKKRLKEYSIIIILLVLVDSLQVLIPLFTKRAVDAITNSKLQILVRNGILIMSISLAIVVIRILYNYLLRRLVLGLDFDIKTRLYDKYIALPKKVFESKEIGDLMSRVTSDTMSVRMFLIMGFLGILDVFFLGATTFVSMFIMSNKLALIVILPLFFLIPLTLNFGKKIHTFYKKVQVIFADMTVRVREVINGIRIIKAFTRENYYLKLFMSVNDEYVRENMKLVKLDGFLDPTINLFTNISILLLLLFGGMFVIKGTVEIGTIVAFFQYIQTLSWPIMAIGFSVALYQRAHASLDRINEMLEIQTYDVKETIYNRFEVKSSLEVKDLSYSYSESNAHVLKNVSLSVYPNEIFGITGPPGSGKSTLIQLLMRVYDPPRGSIFIDGVDILDMNITTLRGYMAYVPQDPFLFSDTILNNILVGRRTATFDEVINASKIAGIYDDIMIFPKGFDTIVGEQGITLSGGERQRVSIARAIVSQKPILILDDSLSAVDTNTEKRIITDLKDYLSENRVLTIIVSQRISALSIANKIQVIVNGKTIECGNPENLLSKKGYYYHLYRKQLLEGIEI
jgi:ATP-binding cassette subfamily B protein